MSQPVRAIVTVPFLATTTDPLRPRVNSLVSSNSTFYAVSKARGQESAFFSTPRARPRFVLVPSCRRLLLQTHRRVSLTLRHFQPWRDVGNECADHAAALNAFGFVSNHGLEERWPPPRQNTTQCAGEQASLFDVEHLAFKVPIFSLGRAMCAFLHPHARVASSFFFGLQFCPTRCLTPSEPLCPCADDCFPCIPHGPSARADNFFSRTLRFVISFPDV